MKKVTIKNIITFIGSVILFFFASLLILAVMVGEHKEYTIAIEKYGDLNNISKIVVDKYTTIDGGYKDIYTEFKIVLDMDDNLETNTDRITLKVNEDIYNKQQVGKMSTSEIVPQLKNYILNN